MPRSSIPSGDVRRAVEDAHRREWATVLAATVRVAGDIDLAEECVQEAYISALGAWQTAGIPSSPGAWLTTTARRKALDVHRRDATLRRKLPLLAEPEEEPDDALSAQASVIGDDRLRMAFTCCHPALAREAQLALTLRLVCGLTTAEIAVACLVSESTMAARVTRAKKKIAAARIPYRVPEDHELPDRLDAVLTVVLLVYTTGHTAPSGGHLVRVDLVERALALARLLCALMPDEREARGLLGLILLTDARRRARTDPEGALVLLEDQDRTLWDQGMVEEGRALVLSALAPRPGRFALQAAIAALHAEAPTFADTDWPQLLGLYDELLGVWSTPVVALNRAVVLAEVGGAEQALREVDVLAADPRLAGYRYLPAVRADLLRRSGRLEEAGDAYREALSLTANGAERGLLLRRLTGLEGGAR